jgi:hypothetical protein
MIRKTTKGLFKKGHIGYWRGKKHPMSQVVKDKIRKKLTGRHLSESHKIRLREFNLGKKLSDETKILIGIASTGRKHSKETLIKISGINAHRWKGGITSENVAIRQSIELKLWRESVFARDNWTCQKYGLRGCKLCAHHIKNFAEYPELRTSIENGITFSDKAHREFHKKYGRKNNTLEQLIEFLKPEGRSMDSKEIFPRENI